MAVTSIGKFFLRLLPAFESLLNILIRDGWRLGGWRVRRIPLNVTWFGSFLFVTWFPAHSLLQLHRKTPGPTHWSGPSSLTGQGPVQRRLCCVLGLPLVLPLARGACLIFSIVIGSWLLYSGSTLALCFSFLSPWNFSLLPNRMLGEGTRGRHRTELFILLLYLVACGKGGRLDRRFGGEAQRPLSSSASCQEVNAMQHEFQWAAARRMDWR